MAAIFTKEDYNYRNFNQINYFENKTISNNERILKEVKSDLEHLDKFAIRKQKRYVIKVMCQENHYYLWANYFH